jgi:hypothetical protein
MKHRLLVVFFILMDWLMATLAWVIFYYFRKTSIEKVDFNIGESFYLGVFTLLFPRNLP